MYSVVAQKLRLRNRRITDMLQAIKFLYLFIVFGGIKNANTY